MTPASAFTKLAVLDAANKAHRHKHLIQFGYPSPGLKMCEKIYRDHIKMWECAFDKVCDSAIVEKAWEIAITGNAINVSPVEKHLDETIDFGT